MKRLFIFIMALGLLSTAGYSQGQINYYSVKGLPRQLYSSAIDSADAFILLNGRVRKIYVTDVMQFKRYYALTTQTGTAIPTDAVLSNNLGGTIVWARLGVGDYTATLTGAFTASKTFVTVGPMADGTAVPIITAVIRTNANTIEFKVSKAGVLTDALWAEAPVEIRVYK